MILHSKGGFVQRYSTNKIICTTIIPLDFKSICVIIAHFHRILAYFTGFYANIRICSVILLKVENIWRTKHGSRIAK